MVYVSISSEEKTGRKLGVKNPKSGKGGTYAKHQMRCGGTGKVYRLITVGTPQGNWRLIPRAQSSWDPIIPLPLFPSSDHRDSDFSLLLFSGFPIPVLTSRPSFYWASLYILLFSTTFQVNFTPSGKQFVSNFPPFFLETRPFLFRSSDLLTLSQHPKP